MSQTQKKEHTITVLLQPTGKEITLPWVKTVWQLMEKLHIGPSSALIIREGRLLTHDQPLKPNDNITVRLVISSG